MTNVILGSMNFGGSTDFESTKAILETANDLGITQIDTANNYLEGKSEEFIGRILKKRNNHSFKISTKVGNPNVAKDDAPLSPPSIRKSVEKSLTRLNIETIDILYFHEPDRTTPIEESILEVEQLSKEGKVARFGLSNYSSWQTEITHSFSTNNSLVIPQVSQQLYNLLARRIETEFKEYSLMRKLEVTVYNPLAGGLLAKPMQLDVIPASGRFSKGQRGKNYRERYWNNEQFSVISTLRKLAEQADMELLELSLRWLLNQTITNGILLGASTQNHVIQNFEAINMGPLENDLATECNEATKILLGVAPHYNR